MRKKGFTLIELLAVILILGIIALIAIPTVTKIIETAKKNSLKVSASGVLEAGNYYYATNGKNIEDEIVFTCSNNKCTNGDKIVNYSGNIENGILVIKKNGDMGICINSGKYYASKDVETDTIESGKGVCDSYNEGIFLISGSSKNDKYKNLVNTLLSAKLLTWEYDYTGGEKEFVIPVDGTYKVEVWRAQGGSEGKIGGYGGYSVGNINLNNDTKLYINVGGTTSSTQGGYNGGGTAKDSFGSRGGGGATHIATSSGLLFSLGVYDENTETYSAPSVLIVAGGGSGSNNLESGISGISGANGASAGGYIGVSGKKAEYTRGSTPGSYTVATGGTQSFGGLSGVGSGLNGNGTFGLGGSFVDNSGSGGGGGYFGGGSGSSNSNVVGTGGGGSSYIGNALLKSKSMYCYGCTESTEESIFTVNTIGTSELRDTTNCPNGYDNDAVSKCAKAGNGYVRITLISLSSNFKKYKELYEYASENEMLSWNFDYTGYERKLNINKKGKYKIELWGAQGGCYSAIDNCLGYGGYSVGEINLDVNDKLYINVGGQGLGVSDQGYGYHQRVAGGYNGGGDAYTWYDDKYVGSGGGATHIATSSGLLKVFSEEKDKVLIVAGGGGGTGGAAGYSNLNENRYSGSAGGYLGQSSPIGDTGGTQSSGGTVNRYNDPGGSGSIIDVSPATFGQGGSNAKWSTNSPGNSSGGGGGFYGGAASFGGGGLGAGGSSYIGNSLLKNKSMYCYNCAESTEENIYTVNTKGTSELIDTLNCPNGYSSNSIAKCAKAGNGYARITLISE